MEREREDSYRTGRVYCTDLTDALCLSRERAIHRGALSAVYPVIYLYRLQQVQHTYRTAVDCSVLSGVLDTTVHTTQASLPDARRGRGLRAVPRHGSGTLHRAQDVSKTLSNRSRPPARALGCAAFRLLWGVACGLLVHGAWWACAVALSRGPLAVSHSHLRLIPMSRSEAKVMHGRMTLPR